MSKKTVQYIRVIYSIALSLMLILTGILLMIACVNIYKIGNRPFTPENISAEFAKIAIPVWITLAMTVIGLILTPVFPTKPNTPKAIKDKKITLALLQKRLDAETCDEATLALLQKERKMHSVLRLVAVAVVCIAAIPAAVYAFNFNHFTADYNASVVSACLWILPCAFVAMGAAVAFLFLENACIERQIGYVKSALRQSKGIAPADSAEARRVSPRLLMGIRIALFAVALALIIAGILNGGMADVLSKATNICTECIGLG